MHDRSLVSCVFVAGRRAKGCAACPGSSQTLLEVVDQTHCVAWAGSKVQKDAEEKGAWKFFICREYLPSRQDGDAASAWILVVADHTCGASCTALPGIIEQPWREEAAGRKFVCWISSCSFSCTSFFFQHHRLLPLTLRSASSSSDMN